MKNQIINISACTIGMVSLWILLAMLRFDASIWDVVRFFMP